MFVNPSPLPSLPVETNVLPPTLWNKLFQCTHERDYVLCVVSYFTRNVVPFVHTFPQVIDFHFLWLRNIHWCIIAHFLYPLITGGQLVWVHIVKMGDGWYIKCGRVGIFSHCIDFISHKYMPITVISTLYGCSYIFSLKIALTIFYSGFINLHFCQQYIGIVPSPYLDRICHLLSQNTST